MQFADRLNNVETSAIRELFKLLGKPGIISFAGGFPDSAMFDVEGIRAASNAALAEEPGAALQYGATEGYNPLREQLAAFMTSKGAKEVAADNLIVTTGSQQALDLLDQHFAPGLVLYLAGADPHVGDRLGRLALSHDGLEARDRRVFDWAWQRRVPLAFTMAGGYGRDMADTLQAQLATWRVALQYHARWQNVRP